jgi:hypothetical protein
VNGRPRRLWPARTPVEVVGKQASGERQDEQREDDVPASWGHEGCILRRTGGWHPLTGGTSGGRTPAYAGAHARAGSIPPKGLSVPWRFPYAELSGTPSDSIRRRSLPTRILPTPWTSLTR